MYRFQTFILVSLFSIICLSIAGCTAHSKKERYVVVLSMDGFRSDYPSHAHTPTLDSLACVGVKAAFRPSFPSVTFPNHYSMATGLHPDHHGLVNNFFYATTGRSGASSQCSTRRMSGCRDSGAANRSGTRRKSRVSEPPRSIGSVVNIRYRDAGLPSGNRSIRMFLFLTGRIR